MTAFSTLCPAPAFQRAARTSPPRLTEARWRRLSAGKVRFFSATAIAALLAFPPMEARAADAARGSSWTVGTGQTVVLAEYYEIQESDCRAMRAPPVIIKTRPTLGKLVVNTTTGQAAKSAKCRHVQVPVTRVLYHAGAEPGHDAFGWQIFFQARDLGTQSVQGSATITRRPPDR